MITIWKYQLNDVENHIEHRLAMNGRFPFLHVDNQHDKITVWAEVDTDSPPEDWILYVVGTGHPIPRQAGVHIGSCLIQGFVFHVYVEHIRAHSDRLDRKTADS